MRRVKKFVFRYKHSGDAVFIMYAKNEKVARSAISKVLIKPKDWEMDNFTQEMMFDDTT